MLVLRPYSLPINPTWKRVNLVLGKQGFLLGSELAPVNGGPQQVLKRWVEENPARVAVSTFGDFAVLRAFAHYINLDPISDFNERTRQTIARWESHRLSRVVTLWIPLSGNKLDFMLSVGSLEEKDVQSLMVELIPGATDKQILSQEFDFPKVRQINPRGWMHGCENRPGVIQRGTLYGDFVFTDKTELNDFYDKPGTTTSNQEGITMEGNRKVRVLKLGKFQLMGIAKEAFTDEELRPDVMKKCFEVATWLLTNAGRSIAPQSPATHVASKTQAPSTKPSRASK